MLITTVSAEDLIPPDTIAPLAQGAFSEEEQYSNGNIQPAQAPRWGTGAIGDSDSDYFEGDSIPYRMVLDDLPQNTWVYFTVTYSSSKAFINSFDFLTSYDYSEAPLDLTSQDSTSTLSTRSSNPVNLIESDVTYDALAIPQDTITQDDLANVGNEVQYFAIGGDWADAGNWADGGALTAPTITCGSNGDCEKVINFKILTSGTTGGPEDRRLVIGWGGHLAIGAGPGGWGAGLGAGSVSGDPYHMATTGWVDLDGEGDNDDGTSLGGGDRQVNTNAVSIPATYCISGYKLDNCTGEGLADWTITLTKPDASTATCTTAADGSYSFCGLAAGTYSVAETLQDGWVSVSPISIGPITLGPSSTNNNFTNHPPICVDGTLTMSGPITGTDVPVQGATINLLDENDAVVDSDTTDVNGDYQICDIEVGKDYTLQAVVDGVEKASTAFSPTTEDCSAAVDLSFEIPSLCINGTKFGCGDTPLENWEINLTGTTDLGDDVDLQTYTDANGDYSFCGLEPGSYTVEETLQDGYDMVSGPTNPIVLTTTNSEDNDFHNQVNNLCINGTLTGCAGAAIADATVTLSGDASDTATTDANGDYSFCGLSPGDYTVTPPDLVGFGDPTPATIDVTLVCDSDTDNDFSYSPDNLCINGTLTGCAGAAIADATVTLSGDASDTATTDANGDYSFCGLSPGDYTVTPPDLVGFGDPTPATIDVTLVCDSDTDNDFSYSPDNLCINGTKTDDAGAPLSGWVITLNPGGETATTDAQGEYSFCGLSPGDYTVTETLQQGWVQVSAPGTITLECDSVENADFVNTPETFDATANGLGFMTGPGKGKDLYTDTQTQWFSLITTKNNNWFMWNKVPGNDATPYTYPIQIGNPKTELRVIGSFTITGGPTSWSWDYTITPGTTFTMDGKTYVVTDVTDARLGVQDNDPYRFKGVPGQDCIYAPGASFTAGEPFYVFAHFVVEYVQVFT
jgi:hypothetical protein